MPLCRDDLARLPSSDIKSPIMEAHKYPIPPGVHALSPDDLDLRPDSDIDALLLHPSPVPDGHEKNIWFFWHSGYATMHPYAKRTVRAYHRRFARRGWAVRVLDVSADHGDSSSSSTSPGHISRFLDVADPALFPRAFREGTITGTYARQHTSDLVRWPLLLRYGGVYADVGLMPIGDLDRLWEASVGGRDPGYEVLSFHMGSPADDSDEGAAERYGLTNYFLGARRGNPLFLRCHRLLLALWAEGEGEEGSGGEGFRTSTEGMHRSGLLRGVPLLGGGGGHAPDVQVALSDYIVQGQAMKMVMGSVDDEDEGEGEQARGWDGPAYVASCVYAMDYMVGSQLVNELTAWRGERAFSLLSLRLPGEGEAESADQRAAREIVEACLARSFAFKLAHGLILAVLGDTLGSLWRRHEGSDDVPGTYAHWLRYGMVHWCPDELPPPTPLRRIKPFKKGPLLQAA